MKYVAYEADNIGIGRTLDEAYDNYVDQGGTQPINELSYASLTPVEIELSIKTVPVKKGS